MIDFDQLHKENHRITELSNVFLYLIRDRTMCDTQIACDLFFEYVERVKHHLDQVDRHMYKKLLSSPDQNVRNKADRFMSGGQEIKRVFQKYLMKWSSAANRSLVIRNHDKFLKETEEMFSLVLDRLQRETEHLYPLVRQVDEELRAAA